MNAIKDIVPERLPNSFELRFEGEEGRTWGLSLRFVEDGCFRLKEARRFEHPHPAFNRLFLFERGGAKLRMDGEEAELGSGRIHLLPSNHSFSIEYAKGSVLHFFHLSVHDESGFDLFAESRLASLGGGLARTLFKEVAEARRQGGMEGAFRWRTALGHAACLFAAELGLEPWRKEGPERKTLAALEQLWRPGVSVKELAEGLGTSPRALAMKFKRLRGEALKPYLTRRTLAKAREELSCSNASVKELAAKLGYVDACHFHRSFKKALGLSPAEYRRRSRETQGAQEAPSRR